jgi:hypothetical protein
MGTLHKHLENWFVAGLQVNSKQEFPYSRLEVSRHKEQESNVIYNIRGLTNVNIKLIMLD